MRSAVSTLAILTVLLTGCGSDTAEPEATPPPSVTESAPEPTSAVAAAPSAAQPAEDATGGQLFPDVVGAEATMSASGTWKFDVTVSSPYDSPQRYADAWRVLDPTGIELGVRILTHDHAAEQPFTRSLSGVEIPDDIGVVIIQARDLTNGWGGASLELELDRG